jgi:hypothetical protein
LARERELESQAADCDAQHSGRRRKMRYGYPSATSI